MKCEICGKDILKDSQCINYKYYHNDCIINLIKENRQLRESNLSMQEEMARTWKKLDNLQEIEKEHQKINGELREENEELKDNWDKLKEYIANEYFMFMPLNATTKSIMILLEKMQELEQGSDNDE